MSDEPPRRLTAGLAEFLGMRLVAPGEVRATAKPELLRQSTGSVTGPVTFALIDYAMGSALWAQIDAERENIATLGISINYVAAGKPDEELIARATVDRRNRSAATLRGEVVAGPDERLIATAIGSFSIFPRKR